MYREDLILWRAGHQRVENLVHLDLVIANVVAAGNRELLRIIAERHQARSISWCGSPAEASRSSRARSGRWKVTVSSAPNAENAADPPSVMRECGELGLPLTISHKA